MRLYLVYAILPLHLLISFFHNPLPIVYNSSPTYPAPSIRWLYFSLFIFHSSFFTLHFSLFIFHFSFFTFHFSLFIFHLKVFYLSLNNSHRFTVLVLKASNPVPFLIIFVLKTLLLSKIPIQQRDNPITIPMAIVAIFSLIENILPLIHYMLFLF